MALVAIVLATGLAVIFYGYRHWQTAVPPSVEVDGIDPAIVAAIDRARQAVVQSPRSAGAWGTLGMTLHAHNFETSAAECYAEAARLNTKEPRWTGKTQRRH